MKALTPDTLHARFAYAAVFLLWIVSSARAEADPWIAPGNLSLRHDIQLLADEGIIRAPITTWPMSWPDVARDVLREPQGGELRVEVSAALARVQRAARRAIGTGLATHAAAELAGDPPALRTFSDTPREDAAVQAGASWMGRRLAAKLVVTAVEDPADDREIRLDGSYVGFALGNFMVSAGAVDRWWGPGWEGSLILSNQARPIPGITIDRNFSEPVSWRPLRWLGPWRASVTFGWLEGSDVAVPEARFFAARLAFKPRPWLELGLSRTAQWCGEGRPCDLETFGRLLVGRDNRSDTLRESEEPGNQMAGYDVRVRSPWRTVPAAFYGQLIGEDEAGGLPSKFLGLLGAEVWGAVPWGSWRLHIEYADTTCNFSRRTPQFGCAYRNRLYPQGYSFRGRAIGHAMDNDSRMYSLGAMLVRPTRESWSLLVRRAELNRDSFTADPAHTISPVRGQLKGVGLQYNRAFTWGELGISLGLDDHAGPLRDGSDVHGFIYVRQDIRQGI